MVQQRPVSVHVWPPLRSFTAYFIAWCVPFLSFMTINTDVQDSANSSGYDSIWSDSSTIQDCG